MRDIAAPALVGLATLLLLGGEAPPRKCMRPFQIMTKAMKHLLQQGTGVYSEGRGHLWLF
jgi:hypothetical protein